MCIINDGWFIVFNAVSNKERRLEGAVELDPLWGSSAYATVARPQSVVSIKKTIESELR